MSGPRKHALPTGGKQLQRRAPARSLRNMSSRMELVQATSLAYGICLAELALADPNNTSPDELAQMQARAEWARGQWVAAVDSIRGKHGQADQAEA